MKIAQHVSLVSFTPWVLEFLRRIFIYNVDFQLRTSLHRWKPVAKFYDSDSWFWERKSTPRVNSCVPYSHCEFPLRVSSPLAIYSPLKENSTRTLTDFSYCYFFSLLFSKYWNAYFNVQLHNFFTVLARLIFVGFLRSLFKYTSMQQTQFFSISYHGT